MKTILFATTNQRKVKEANAACNKFNIKVVQLKLDIAEIQSFDPKKIAIEKAKSAYKQIKKPVVVCDTFWSIPSLNGFPGGYMKDVADWFRAGDFLNLMNNKKDRRISFTETIVYKNNKIIKVFRKEYWGYFSDKPLGSGVSIEKVAVFNGMTIGEHRDKSETSYKPEDYIWYDFAKWYSK